MVSSLIVVIYSLDVCLVFQSWQLCTTTALVFICYNNQYHAACLVHVICSCNSANLEWISSNVIFYAHQPLSRLPDQTIWEQICKTPNNFAFSKIEIFVSQYSRCLSLSSVAIPYSLKFSRVKFLRISKIFVWP